LAHDIHAVAKENRRIKFSSSDQERRAFVLRKKSLFSDFFMKKVNKKDMIVK